MARKSKTSTLKLKSPVISIPDLPVSESDVLMRTLLWDFFSITNHLSNIRTIWADMTGITGPQWNIIMALDYLDEGEGVPVGEIANRLHVKSTFVTAQSKLMEQSGHLYRIPSKQDKRIVLLSLTPQAINSINTFYEKRRYINQMIFGEFSGQEFHHLVQQIEGIRVRTERALVELKNKLEH